MKRVMRCLLILGAAGMLAFLGACSGGGSSNNPTTKAGTTLSGVAAAGAPIAGIVNVEGANGETASAEIGTDGAFSLDVSALTAPYILYAEGSANGQSVRLFSSAVATGKINITPVTDFILRSALAGDPETALNDWQNTAADVTKETLDAATQKVKDQLQPVLTGVGVPDTFNPMSSSFTPNGTGFDQALDDLSITYDESGTTATVTNKVTDSSFTDDVTTTSDDSNCLPSSDESATQAAQTDEEAIGGIFQKLADLYATTEPSRQQVTDFFYANTPADFLNDGMDRDQQIAAWQGDDAPPVGIAFSNIVLEQPLTVSGYSKAYQVAAKFTFSGTSKTLTTEMVYDGTSWLWYGNRHWIDYGFNPEAHMTVDSTGAATFDTGFDCWFRDDFNYAYDKGIRSAVIIGPGLPANGLVLASNYPDTQFEIYPGGNGDQYWISDDSVLSAIPDNSTYTIKLCAEDASVASATNCTGGQETTETIAKHPVLNSELNASLFPVLTSPTSHDIADFNIGGVLNLAWTNPANVQMSDAEIDWWDNTNWNQVDSKVPSGASTVSLDTSTYSSTATDGQIWLDGSDLYGREFSLEWDFQ